MKKILLVIGLILLPVTKSFAEGAKPFTGLFAAIGESRGVGDFTLSHQGPQFSVGKILEIPLAGATTTYEVGYRFQLRNSHLRFGVNAVMHDGTIGGSKHWQSRYATASAVIASDLRLSLGTEVGAVLGRHERLYAYAGVGFVATDLTAQLTLDTPLGGWTEQKTGGAIGAIYSIGVRYQINNRWSLGVHASQMRFNAAKAFGLGDMGTQHLSADLSQTTAGFNLSFNF